MAYRHRPTYIEFQTKSADAQISSRVSQPDSCRYSKGIQKKLPHDPGKCPSLRPNGRPDRIKMLKIIAPGSSERPASILNTVTGRELHTLADLKVLLSGESASYSIFD
jgi:hypothetical protein